MQQKINIEQFICDLYEKQLEGSIEKNHIADCLQNQGLKVTDGKLVEIGKKPKFKVGDWVIWQNKYYKVNYNGCGYELIDQNGLSTSLEYGTVDKSAHLWTIDDAKDGDVLVYGDNPNDCHVEVIMIFKSLRNKHSAFTHFHIFDDEFRINDWCDCGENAHPATKEQRDFLFSKMKEAGYEWDAENKKLVELKECITILKSEYNFLLSCKQRLIEMHKTEIQKCYNEIKTNVVSSIVNSSKQ